VETFEVIHSRRAVKHSEKDHLMPEEDLRTLLEAAIQSPTSFNIQHWRFVVVRDKERRRRLRAAGNDLRPLADGTGPTESGTARSPEVHETSKDSVRSNRTI